MASLRVQLVLLFVALFAITSVYAAPTKRASKYIPPRQVLDKLLSSKSLSTKGRTYLEDALKIDANISAYYLGDGKTKPTTSTTKILEKRSSGSGAVDSATLAFLEIYPYIITSSYCDASAVTAWTCTPCAKVSAPQSIQHANVADLDFYAAYFPSQKHIVVAFRGSETLSNWISNLDFGFDKYSGTGAPSNAKVHSGWQELYGKVKSTVHSLVNSLSSTYPSASITFAGHSMGAAIAAFAAVDLHTTGYNSNLPSSKVRLITMGEPRIGNDHFSNWVSGTLSWPSGLYRVVNYNDIVPHLPYMWTGYRHHLREYWLDGDGNAVTCDDVDNSDYEDDNCANTKSWSTSISAHLVYFGITMGSSAC